MVESTVYKPVTYQGKGNGTLKLFDDQLTFHMFDINATTTTEIFTIEFKSWKESEEKRQVSGRDEESAKSRRERGEKRTSISDEQEAGAI